MKKITKQLVAQIAESMLGPNSLVGDGVDWDFAPMVHEVVESALKQYKAQCHEEATPVYQAYICDGGYTVTEGFYIGSEHDIQARVGNRYDITEIEIEIVPSGYAEHKKNLIAKKKALQAELIKIEERLNSGEIH